MINLDAVLVLIILSAVVGTVSMTLAKSSLFRWIQTKFTGLGCPYCMGHWIAFGLMFLYHPLVLLTPSYMSIGVDYIVSYFVLISLSAVWQLIISALFVVLEFKQGD